MNFFKKINPFLLFRLIIGSIFFISGFEKTTSHYQNFLYVIQNYEFLPAALENISAHFIPWLELIVGLTLLVGIWTKLSLRIIQVLLGCFIVIVAQAIIRQLDVVDCGCGVGGFSCGVAACVFVVFVVVVCGVDGVD